MSVWVEYNPNPVKVSEEDEALELLEQAMMAVKDERTREEIRQMIHSVKDR